MFVQVIEMLVDPDQYPEVDRLEQEWRGRTEGQRTVLRTTLCRDRSDASRVVAIVEFASAEDAGRNDALPATGEFAERVRALARDVRYLDLDVERVDVG